MPFLGERHQNIFMVSWTCLRALLNWLAFRSGGVFRLRGATAISQQARAAEGLLGKMSSRGILEGGCRGNISPWCIPERSPMTEMCSPASDSGKISPRCVFGRRSVAAFSLHAFPKGPRTGKTPVRGNISPPCIQNGLASARYARRASEKPCERAFGDAPREDLARKGPLSLHGPLKSCTARRSCHSWVLRLSALIFLRQGRCLRFAHCPPACVPLPRIARSCAVSGWVAAPPPACAPAPKPRCWVCLPRRPRAASSCLHLCRRVRDEAETAGSCRLPQKTWRCDGVSLNCRCSAVLF